MNTWRPKWLLVGNGGREHALAWALSKSSAKPQMFFTGENAGMDRLGTSIPSLSSTDIPSLLGFALEMKIDFTFVGPEAPLELGIGDIFRANGLRIIAPSRMAASIETSKLQAKSLMVYSAISTPSWIATPSYTEAVNIPRMYHIQ